MVGWLGGLAASSASGLSKLLRKTLVKGDLQSPNPRPAPSTAVDLSPLPLALALGEAEVTLHS